MSKLKDNLNRRSFLTKVTSLMAGIPLILSKNVSALKPNNRFQSNKYAHLYFDESGIFGIDKVFIIGMLLTTNPRKLEYFIHQKRLKHNFWTQLKYSSTDKFKYPLARDLINYLFSESEIQFSAYVINHKEIHNLKSKSMPLERIYQYYYNELISNCTSIGITKILNLETRNSIGNDRLLRVYLRESIKRLGRINIINSYNNDLIQFSDFLTGCINCDIYSKYIPNKVKLSLTNLIKNKLQVSNLTDRRLRNENIPFRVFVV